MILSLSGFFSTISSIWPARSLFRRLSGDDGAGRRCRGSLRRGIILRRRCLRHDRAQNSPAPAEIAPVDGSPRDENGQSFPRTTTGMEPDSTRLDSTLVDLDRLDSLPFSLSPAPALALALACVLILPFPHLSDSSSVHPSRRSSPTRCSSARINLRRYTWRSS